MDSIIEDSIPRLLPIDMPEQDRKQIIEQFKRNLYANNLPSLSGQAASLVYQNEVDKLMEVAISQPSDVVANYVDEKYRPIWQYTDVFGDVHSGLTYDEALGIVRPKVYGSRGIDAQYTQDAIKAANTLLQHTPEGGIAYLPIAKSLPALAMSGEQVAPSSRDRWVAYFKSQTSSMQNFIDNTVANQVKNGVAKRVFDPTVGDLAYETAGKSAMNKEEFFAYLLESDSSIKHSYNEKYHSDEVRDEAERIFDATLRAGMLEEMYLIGVNEFTSFMDVVEYASQFLDISDYTAMPQRMPSHTSDDLSGSTDTANNFEDA